MPTISKEQISKFLWEAKSLTQSPHHFPAISKEQTTKFFVGNQIFNQESAPFSQNFKGTNIKVFVGSQIINPMTWWTSVGIPNFFCWTFVGRTDCENFSRHSKLFWWTFVGLPNVFVGIVGIVFLWKLHQNLNLYINFGCQQFPRNKLQSFCWQPNP